MKKNYILFYITLGMLFELINTNINAMVQYNHPMVQSSLPNVVTHRSTHESNFQYARELSIENKFGVIPTANNDLRSNFENFKKDAIHFLYKQDVSYPDSEGRDGYFKNIPDKNNEFRYPGVALVGQERYINVVAVNAKNVSRDNETMPLNAQNNAKNANSNKFDPGYLIFLGSFVNPHSGTTYYLYGQYANTIMPIDDLDSRGNYSIERT